MFLLECPRCKNRMKYQPAKASGNKGIRFAHALINPTDVAVPLINPDVDVSKKVKKCVYCNFSMNVAGSVVQQL